MKTVPQLYIKSKIKNITGSNNCFYCGAVCSDDFSIKEFVKKTFTGHNTVKRPNSQYICQGCVYCFNEKSEITLISGEKRENQKPRSYSWLITEKATIAVTKAHLKEIRKFCLNPPGGLYAIVLSESGQKQLLYRGIVNSDKSQVILTLEEDIIKFIPSKLNDRIELCKKLIACTGKPALLQDMNFNFCNKVLEHFEENLLMEWERVSQEPLSKLAIWLSPNKEMCQNEYNFTRGIPPKTGGAVKGVGNIKSDRSTGNQRDSDQVLFDFS